MGSLDVLYWDDSSDLGSLKEQGASGLRDGDLALADLQPGHPIESMEDRRMMMSGHGSEHAQNTRGTRWGSSPDVWFYGEPLSDFAEQNRENLKIYKKFFTNNYILI